MGCESQRAWSSTIDDVRKLLEKAGARRKRLVEAACAHEVQDGIRQVVETVVLEEKGGRARGGNGRGRRGPLGGLPL
jgi:hypothetical protein